MIEKVILWDRTQCGERSWSQHLMSILDSVDLLTDYENMQPFDITYFIGQQQLEHAIRCMANGHPKYS